MAAAVQVLTQEEETLAVEAAILCLEVLQLLAEAEALHGMVAQQICQGVVVVEPAKEILFGAPETLQRLHLHKVISVAHRADQ